jgi:hypothetical protein
MLYVLGTELVEVFADDRHHASQDRVIYSDPARAREDVNTGH